MKANRVFAPHTQESLLNVTQVFVVQPGILQRKGKVNCSVVAWDMVLKGAKVEQWALFDLAPVRPCVAAQCPYLLRQVKAQVRGW